MQATAFETLRDLVIHHAARQGWRTQRHIAVICGMDESALSRFLSGEQDIGARRTHRLFQAVGVPVEQYDLAYALLGRAQEQAETNRAARSSRARLAAPPSRAAEPGRGAGTPAGVLRPRVDGWERDERGWPGRGRGDGWYAGVLGRTAPVAPGWDAGAWRLMPETAIADDIPASLAVALFAANASTGDQIAAFFSDDDTP